MADQAESTIFDNAPETPEVVVEASENVAPAASEEKDAYADLLASIKAEDGRQKYTSVDQAIKALLHSQDHIKRLEEEQESLRGEVDRRKTAEEVLERIEASKQTAEKPSEVKVDEATLSRIVEAKLTQAEATKHKRNNLLSADKAMKDTYGETATEVLKAKSIELGLSVDKLMQTASESPNAFLKLMGVGEKMASTVSLKSSVNTSALQSQNKPQQGMKVPAYANSKQLADVWNSYKPE